MSLSSQPGDHNKMDEYCMLKKDKTFEDVILAATETGNITELQELSATTAEETVGFSQVGQTPRKKGSVSKMSNNYAKRLS